MTVIFQMTYQKKLGLPNYSSHSCAVSLMAGPALSASRHKPLPRAFQCALQSKNSRHQNVDVAALNLLNSADVQIDEFCQPLLREIASHPLAADIGSKGHTLGISSSFRHAPLGRCADLTTTAQWGVNCQREKATS